MRLILELIFVICTVLAASRAETTSFTSQANAPPEEHFLLPSELFDLNPAEACKPYNNLTAVLCKGTRFKVNEAIPFDHPVKEVYFVAIQGSIGVKTLSPFQDAELLLIRMSEIYHIEGAALCSLPKLKRLVIERSTIPPITKEILSGCDNIEDISIENGIVEENALHELTNLKKLSLSNIKYYNFRKAYIEPLDKLEYLSIEGDTVKVEDVEPGMFCTSPNLKTLKVDIELSVPLRYSLFENCDSVKSLYISFYGSIHDGENPVQKMPHLEELHLISPSINRLTKRIIDTVPNLKILSVRCSGIDDDAFVDAVHLKELSIGGSELSDLVAIGKAVNLEVLDLSLFHVPSVIENLPKLKNLRRLNLSYTLTSKLDLPALKQKFPNLKEVNFHNYQFDPDFEEEIKKHQELKVTNIYHDVDPYYARDTGAYKTADGEPLIPYIPN